jgi:hypothetical protein
MLGTRMVRLIETHSDRLAEGLMRKLRHCDRTSEFRRVPQAELHEAAQEVYHNLGDWLVTKTESDIEVRYTQIGARRAEQGVPVQQFVWAILLSKEHLWGFLQREGLAEGPVEIFGELELLQLLEQFFDRALYYAVVGYEHARARNPERAEKAA